MRIDTVTTEVKKQEGRQNISRKNKDERHFTGKDITGRQSEQLTWKMDRVLIRPGDSDTVKQRQLIDRGITLLRRFQNGRLQRQQTHRFRQINILQF